MCVSLVDLNHFILLQVSTAGRSQLNPKTVLKSEPGIYCGNGDSRRNENRKLQEKIFSVRGGKNQEAYFFFYEN